MALADAVNGYFDLAKPWVLAKSDDPDDELHCIVCTQLLEGFRLLTIYLKPVLPALAAEVEAFLGLPPQRWADLDVPLAPGAADRPYRHLMRRVETKQLDALFEPAAPAAAPAVATAAAPSTDAAIEPIAPTIKIDDFGRIDLRIARIVRAEKVEGSTSCCG